VLRIGRAAAISARQNFPAAYEAPCHPPPGFFDLRSVKTPELHLGLSGILKVLLDVVGEIHLFGPLVLGSGF
jgi:hypothetical protein